MSDRHRSKVTRLSVEEWRKAKLRVDSKAVGGVLKGWTPMDHEPPAHDQWVLTCSDPNPEWGGPYNPKLSLMKYMELAESPSLRERFPEETDTAYIENECGGFSGVFLTSGLDFCLVADGPWFPDYWMPLPQTPFEDDLSNAD